MERGTFPYFTGLSQMKLREIFVVFRNFIYSTLNADFKRDIGLSLVPRWYFTITVWKE